MEMSEVRRRLDPLSAKIQKGRRLSAAEAREMSDLSKIASAHAKREIDEVNSWNPAAFMAEKRAVIDEQIKGAQNRGVALRISSEPASMIKPPKGYDVFEGRKCSGPGLPGRWGKPGVCGRQAMMVLKSGSFEPPRTGEASAETYKKSLGYMAYGPGQGERVWAAGGPQVGNLIVDPMAPPNDNDTFVCLFHASAENFKVPHPDDVPPEPKPAPVVAEVGSLSDLNPGRQWRTISSDPNYINLTDGVTSVLVRTSEYIAYLRDNGTLPQIGEPL